MEPVRRPHPKSVAGRRTQANPYAQQVMAKNRQDMRDRRGAFLEKKLTEATERLKSLQTENFDLKKQVRLSNVNSKLLRDSLDKAEAMQRKVQGTDVQYTRLQTDHHAVLELLEKATGENQRLQQRELGLKEKLEDLLNENDELIAVLRTEQTGQRVQEIVNGQNRPLLNRVRLPGRRPAIVRLFNVLHTGLQARLEAATQQAMCERMLTQQQVQSQAVGARQHLGKILAAVTDLAKEVEELEHDLLDAAIRERECTQLLTSLQHP